MSARKPKLTNDDLALAWFACGYAASFWKLRGRGAYGRAERAKYDALSLKLDRMIEREPAGDDE